jgi:hypothetical protein
MELRAYLAAYPNGAFAALARYRLQQSQPPSPPSAVPSPATVLARLTPIASHFPLVDGVTLDLDATGLRSTSNMRLTVVPASTPVPITDPDGLVLNSTAVAATHLRLTIPAGPAGADEVRLYAIPNTGTAYVLAARAPVTIDQGVFGATLVRDLAREAARLGPVGFEAEHRDQSMLIQGAFLSLSPRTSWNVQWFAGQPIERIGSQVVILNIGQPNVMPDVYGATGNAVCVIAVPDTATLRRVAGLRVGEPILISAIPTSWGNARPSDPVVLNRCVLQR